MYFTDYHTHTRLSPDSEADLLDMAQAAVDAGLRELCVTDHYDLLTFDGKLTDEDVDWQAATAQIEAVRARFQGRLTLRLGLELGSGHVNPEKTAANLAQPILDFVIGSLHNQSERLGRQDFYFVNYTSPEVCHQNLEDYFLQMEQLAPLPCYDCLGHIIYPLRYMCMRDGQVVTLERYMDQIRTILTSAIQTGHGIEVNTYTGRTVEDWRPILCLYKSLGGEVITVGSDAHQADRVALGVREAYALLEDVGFRYITTYQGRTPSFVRLGA